MIVRSTPFAFLVLCPLQFAACGDTAGEPSGNANVISSPAGPSGSGMPVNPGAAATSPGQGQSELGSTGLPGSGSAGETGAAGQPSSGVAPAPPGATGAPIGAEGSAGASAAEPPGSSAEQGGTPELPEGADAEPEDTTETEPVNADPPFYPTTISLSDSQAAYDEWKSVHLEDCGSGVWRVPWETFRLDSTVSEGIGYGMLLTVVFDDRAAFDGLLEYSKLMRAPNGLMHWLRHGCDAHRETTYSDYPDNSASDADLDVAMALLMAQCRWGDTRYGDEATPVINAIREHMFMDHNGMHVLQPGDSTWFDMMGAGCVNYSYFAPAYYRAFAEHLPQDAGFWNKAADDTYPLLEAATDPTTGLVRNWGSADGNQATDECHNAYHHAGSYGPDAARTPWRIATDFLWYGTPAAKQWNDVLTQFVRDDGIENAVEWYHLDGNPNTEADSSNGRTAITVGPFAVGAMTLDQATVDAFAAELVAIPVVDGEAQYFPRMLKALSMIALTGQFTQCAGQ